MLSAQKKKSDEYYGRWLENSNEMKKRITQKIMSKIKNQPNGIKKKEIKNNTLAPESLM